MPPAADAAAKAAELIAKAGLFRAWACQAMGKIGTAADLPLLREVAEKDPMQRERGGCLAPMNKDIVYPVRDAAHEVIKTLQAGPSAPDTTQPATVPPAKAATQPAVGGLLPASSVRSLSSRHP